MEDNISNESDPFFGAQGQYIAIGIESQAGPNRQSLNRDVPESKVEREEGTLWNILLLPVANLGYGSSHRILVDGMTANEITSIHSIRMGYQAVRPARPSRLLPPRFLTIPLS